MCSYSEQVEDVEHYNASIQVDFDAKMNSFKQMKWFLWTFGTLKSTVHVLEMVLMLQRTISNIPNGYSMYIDYKQKNSSHHKLL